MLDSHGLETSYSRWPYCKSIYRGQSARTHSASTPNGAYIQSKTDGVTKIPQTDASVGVRRRLVGWPTAAGWVLVSQIVHVARTTERRTRTCHPFIGGVGNASRIQDQRTLRRRMARAIPADRPLLPHTAIRASKNLKTFLAISRKRNSLLLMRHILHGASSSLLWLAQRGSIGGRLMGSAFLRPFGL